VREVRELEEEENEEEEVEVETDDEEFEDFISGKMRNLRILSARR